MDVERIQKINNLALDLMKQGLAPDREAAIQQAEKIFRADRGEFSEMRERMAETPESQEEKQDVADLSQDQVKDILQQNSTFLVKTIKEFQEKINSLEREIKQLRTQMTYNKLPTVKEVISNKEEQVAPKIGEVHVNNEPPKDHPRVGKYEEEDVSVEKFFYMGSK